MNRPYVKQFNQKGECINPIIDAYIPEGENRKARREWKNEPPFVGNGKNYHLTVNHMGKFHRVVQWIKGKRILHYLPSC